MFTKETDLAKEVICWLKDQQWEVYQEVGTGYGNPVCDIVAVQNNIVWALECKLSASLALLKSANNWCGWYANYVSVVVPEVNRKNRDVRGMFERYARHDGIGVVRVGTNHIWETVRPRLWRCKGKGIYGLRHYLVEAQKTMCEAGSKGGGHWTSFRQTCINMERVVRDNPGITMKELMGKVEHHYRSSSTARSCILKWLQDSKIPGVRFEKQGRAFMLYPIGEVKENDNI